MAVIIQDFQAVQEEGQSGAGESGSAPPAQAPVVHAALERMLVARRARLLRLWAH